MYANSAAIAAAVDAYLAIYPAQIIWNLHMSLKKKIGLSLALGLGAWYSIPMLSCTILILTRQCLYHGRGQMHPSSLAIQRA